MAAPTEDEQFAHEIADLWVEQEWAPNFVNACGCPLGGAHVGLSAPKTDAYWLCHYSLVAYVNSRYQEMKEPLPEGPIVRPIVGSELTLAVWEDRLRDFDLYLDAAVMGAGPEDSTMARIAASGTYRPGPELFVRLWRSCVRQDLVLHLDELPIVVGEEKNCMPGAVWYYTPCKCCKCHPTGEAGALAQLYKHLNVAEQIDGALGCVSSVIASFVVDLPVRSSPGIRMRVNDYGVIGSILREIKEAHQQRMTNVWLRPYRSPRWEGCYSFRFVLTNVQPSREMVRWGKSEMPPEPVGMIPVSHFRAGPMIPDIHLVPMIRAS